MSQTPPRELPDPGDTIERSLQRFATLIRESPHNLLSPRGLDELEARHFPESLAFAATLPLGPRVLDIGSGGGIPGLVVALARPDLDVHLLDATRKKTDFLVSAAEELGLGVTVHHGRAEDLATGALAGRFEIVTARAVAPMDRLVPWAAPFLREAGTLHAIKGDRWREELEQAASGMREAGLEVIGTPSSPAPEAAPSEAPKVIVLRRRGRGDRPGGRGSRLGQSTSKAVKERAAGAQ